MSALCGAFVTMPGQALAGPETSMRQFSSSQIKKGVRALGMGGDGATVGNYGLVWKDAGGAVFDYGYTQYTDTGDTFNFLAVGMATPKLPDDWVIFLVAMGSWAPDMKFHAKTADYSKGADFLTEGGDTAVFLKFARPLGAGFSIGGLVGYERSSAAGGLQTGAGSVSYGSAYRPSGGAGLAWESGKHWLAGVRVLTSNDFETITGPAHSVGNMTGSWEFRGGVAFMPLKGTVLDLGYSGLLSHSGGKYADLVNNVVGGAEQKIGSHLAIRAGWNETSPCAGFSVAFKPIKVDFAYVHDLAVARTNNLFGNHNNSGVMTINYDYGEEKEPHAAEPTAPLNPAAPAEAK